MSTHEQKFFVSDTGAVFPTSGGIYKIKNAGSGFWLDNNKFAIQDENPVGVHEANNSNNQSWKILIYPSSNGETVFTLQVVSTLQSNSGAIDGRGGYLRLNPEDNTLVHGGQPQAWKLIQPNRNKLIFKIAPFEAAFNHGKNVVATAMMNSKIAGSNANKVEVKGESDDDNQLWTFQFN